MPEAPRCDNFVDVTDPTAFGTKDDHLDRLSCLLAWYIYDTYTVHSQPVNVLAHSMGGLLLRFAVGATTAGYGNFPPRPLWVLNAVTVATPHGGIYGQYFFDASLAPATNGQELDDMQTNPTSDFMTVIARFDKPQGFLGTRWALIGAADGPYGGAGCSAPAAGWTPDGGNSVSCRTNLQGDGVVPTDSQMAMSADFKIVYGVQGITSETGTSAPNIADVHTQYEHETGLGCLLPTTCFNGPYYLNDGQQATNPTDPAATKAWVCPSGCGPGIPGGSPVPAFRSLQTIAAQLGGAVVCPAGHFSDGSTDQGLLTAYNADGASSTLGCPFDNEGGIFVHFWDGPRQDVQDFTGGSFGPAILVDGPQGSYFLNFGFRNTYLAGAAAACGAPTDNAYGYNGGTRQDFLGCYLTWTAATGVVAHGPCTDYGGTIMTGPNACTGFTIPTNSGPWFSGGAGLLGQEIWTYGNGTTTDSQASYSLNGIDTSQAFQLQAYIPNAHATAHRAHYHYCAPGGGRGDTFLDQDPLSNVWATIGTDCTTDGTATVTLSDDGGDTYPAQIGADAIRAVPIGIACS